MYPHAYHQTRPKTCTTLRDQDTVEYRVEASWLVAAGQNSQTLELGEDGLTGD